MNWLTKKGFHNQKTQNQKETSESKKKKKNDDEAAKKMEDFRMPLHYPKYSKEDYLNMEEWRLDLLLIQYGLLDHVNGTLHYKRDFAMGAFLWPHQF
ncbi:unnamed protein product [Amaranthus hypochondriacus]